MTFHWDSWMKFTFPLGENSPPSSFPPINATGLVHGVMVSRYPAPLSICVSYEIALHLQSQLSVTTALISHPARRTGQRACPIGTGADRFAHRFSNQQYRTGICNSVGSQHVHCHVPLRGKWVSYYGGLSLSFSLLLEKDPYHSEYDNKSGPICPPIKRAGCRFVRNSWKCATGRLLLLRALGLHLEHRNIVWVV